MYIEDFQITYILKKNKSEYMCENFVKFYQIGNGLSYLDCTIKYRK